MYKGGPKGEGEEEEKKEEEGKGIGEGTQPFIFHPKGGWLVGWLLEQKARWGYFIHLHNI